MRTKSVFLVWAWLILAPSLSAQTILDLRAGIREQLKTKNGKAMSITYNSTFYNGGGKKKEKREVLFSALMDTIRHRVYSGSKSASEECFVLAKNGKTLRITYNKLNNKVWKKDVEKQFEYSESGIKSIRTVNDKGEVLLTTTFVTDAKKNPIKSTSYNSKGELAGFESAVYNYKYNTWVHAIFDKDGKLKSEIRRKLVAPQDTYKTYNEHGDCVLQLLDKDKQKYLVTTYKYDSQGNWIKKKVVEAKKVGGKWKDKKKREKQKRKIRYYN